VPDDEAALLAAMEALVRKHPRYGYRRVWAKLRQAGWRVNRKRVYRLWRREGLKVPQKQGKKRRLGHSASGCVRRRAGGKDDVWAWDFIHDRDEHGRPLKWLSLVDEYTRECLLLEVDQLGALGARGGPSWCQKAVQDWRCVAPAVMRWQKRCQPPKRRISRWGRKSDAGWQLVSTGVACWLGAGEGIRTLDVQLGNRPRC